MQANIKRYRPTVSHGNTTGNFGKELTPVKYLLKLFSSQEGRATEACRGSFSY